LRKGRKTKEGGLIYIKRKTNGAVNCKLEGVTGEESEKFPGGGEERQLRLRVDVGRKRGQSNLKIRGA